jgi:hypothetical protein
LFLNLVFFNWVLFFLFCFVLPSIFLFYYCEGFFKSLFHFIFISIFFSLYYQLTITIFLSPFSPLSLSFLHLCYNPLFSFPNTLFTTSHPPSPLALLSSSHPPPTCHITTPSYTLTTCWLIHVPTLHNPNALQSLTQAPSTIRTEIHPSTHKGHKTRQPPYCFPHSPTQLPVSPFSTTLTNFHR